MDNQIIETFLAQQNLQHNYKFVTNEVKKKINVNIDRYPGMDRQFQKMALAISNSKKGNNPNLSELNSDLVNHSTNYFCKKITDIKKKKQEQKNQNNGQNNGQYNNIVNSYNELLEHKQLNNEKSDIDNNMFQHGNMVNTINNLTDVNNNNYHNSLTNEMDNNQNQFNYSQQQQHGQGQQQSVVNQEPNILPFNINEDISNMLASSQIGEDLPLYQNIIELTDNSTDLMKKVEILDNERSSGLFTSSSSDNSFSLNYNNINQKKQDNMLKQNIYTNTNNINSNITM